MQFQVLGGTCIVERILITLKLILTNMDSCGSTILLMVLMQDALLNQHFLAFSQVGSFLMGWFGVVFKGDISRVSDFLAIGLTTGYLGSLTTFSGWNQKMLELSVDGHWVSSILGFLIGKMSIISESCRNNWCRYMAMTSGKLLTSMSSLNSGASSIYSEQDKLIPYIVSLQACFLLPTP